MECKLEKITIYYEIYGDGYPVLMLHGWTVDHRIMKGCMEPLFETRPNYKRIYFDLPGMGKTKGEDWIKGTDDYLKIIIEFVNKIIPNESFIVVGESYGGYLARGLIKEKQNSIDGILFLVPVIIPHREQRDLPEHVILMKDENVVSKLSPFEREGFENIATVINQKVWERGSEEGMSGISIADMKFLDKAGENYAFSFNIDLINEKFNKPTLFLLGRQDSTVGYRDAWKIIENYPRATYAILDTAGHILQIEQEELFNVLTNDWLDRVEYSLNKSI
ncbi:MAG: alpha/beta hydrolase [Candidatus Lokiarchaeota archaeon]|nr:alpha/beta hydrolase [Candidatus Lokiarchaeota archaeon]